MAEFKEVMKQFARMTDTLTDCSDCPLRSHCSEIDCVDVLLGYFEFSEEVIMEWAEKNPEPNYPTWEQWQNETFPDHGATQGIQPCVFMPLTKKCLEGDGYGECWRCRRQPIPAEFAEKLGIKPLNNKGE